MEKCPWIVLDVSFSSSQYLIINKQPIFYVLYSCIKWFLSLKDDVIPIIFNVGIQKQK